LKKGPYNEFVIYHLLFSVFADVWIY